MAAKTDEEPGSPNKRRRLPAADPVGANPFSSVSLFSAPSSGSAPASNPFAGVSLFSASPVAASGSTFGSTSPAPASNPFAGVSLFGASSAGTSGGSNPFAGVSLFGASSASTAGGTAGGTAAGAAAGGGLFTSFASPSAGGFSGFTASAGLATGSTTGGIAAAAASATAGSKTDNPFMGLSLFASQGTEGKNLFAATAASAASVAQEPSTSGTPAEPKADAPSGGDAAAAKDAAESDAESGDELEPLAEGGETGEENEEVVFRGECKLVKLVQAASADAAKESAGEKAASGDAAAKPADDATKGQDKSWRWQERGCGIVHINRHSKTGAGRLVMRMRGVGKLLLNTPVFPTGKYEKVGQKSVRFIGVDVDAEGKDAIDSKPVLCSYRLSLQAGDKQGEFLTVLRDRLNVTSAA